MKSGGPQRTSGAPGDRLLGRRQGGAPTLRPTAVGVFSEVLVGRIGYGVGTAEVLGAGRARRSLGDLPVFAGRCWGRGVGALFGHLWDGTPGGTGC